MYNEKVMDHFENPRNQKGIQNVNAEGTVTSPSCGDTTHITLEIVDGVIKDVNFKTFGCAAAIASSSVLTEMVKGKTLEEAESITTAQLVDEMGGLPPQKVHCSVLAADALKAAIEAYRKEA